MDKTILHVDCNAFYVGCELSERPSLRGKAVVVGGDEKARHGIVLAKSDKAKAAGIKTADTIWEAKKRCPGLIVLPPNYALYLRISREVRAILGDYAGNIEPFGIDEAWVGLGTDTIAQGKRCADEIRRRTWEELGITTSVGVADNKIMAKLGSDYKKPDATTVIAPADYPGVAWPLPAGALLGVGGATQTKLKRVGILTIGDLAHTPPETLRHMLGVNGVLLWRYANGLDKMPVAAAGSVPDVQSVSNSTTTPRDMCCVEDVRLTCWMLADTVAARLRALNLRARTVQIFVRDNTLFSFVRQKKLVRPTDLAAEITQTSMDLFERNYNLCVQKPLRALGVCCTDVESADGGMQLSMFTDEASRMRQEAVARAVDAIRERFGPAAIRRAALMGKSGALQENQMIQPFARQ